MHAVTYNSVPSGPLKSVLYLSSKRSSCTGKIAEEVRGNVRRKAGPSTHALLISENRQMRCWIGKRDCYWMANFTLGGMDTWPYDIRVRKWLIHPVFRHWMGLVLLSELLLKTHSTRTEKGNPRCFGSRAISRLNWIGLCRRNIVCYCCMIKTV